MDVFKYQDSGELVAPEIEAVDEMTASELAVMALISAVKDKNDYASGQDFPNIPFGD